MWNKVLLYLTAILLLLLGWWALALVLDSNALPTPPTTFEAFWVAIGGPLKVHLAASLTRVVVSIILAVLLAVPTGLVLGRVKWLDWLAGPLIFLTYPVPKIVFLPVFMAIFGLGNLSKVLLVGLIVFYQMLVTTWDAARAISPQLIYSVTSLGAREWDLYRHVLFPAVLPKIFTALRIGLGTAIAVLFIAENYATNRGLGFYLLETWSRGAYDEMYAGIIAMGLMGWGLYQVLGWLERKACPWMAD